MLRCVSVCNLPVARALLLRSFAVSVHDTAAWSVFGLEVTASIWESGVEQPSPRNENPFSTEVFIGCWESCWF
jgi:hypothetical protein